MGFEVGSCVGKRVEGFLLGLGVEIVGEAVRPGVGEVVG